MGAQRPVYTKSGNYYDKDIVVSCIKLCIGFDANVAIVIFIVIVKGP